jgi:hypothetical protein
MANNENIISAKYHQHGSEIAAAMAKTWPGVMAAA